MIRARICLGADSPFRYGRKIAVAPHIVSKDFGDDVLIFASPHKLNREAHDILKLGKEVATNRSKAFWEIFAKRSNESVHLLPVNVLANIARSLEFSPNSDLITGTCKVMSDYVSQKSGFREPVVSMSDLLALFKFFNKYLLAIDDKLYKSLLGTLEKSIHLVVADDVEDIVHEVGEMSQRIRRKSEEVSRIESLILKRLLVVSK